jgi:hemoglobin-like flavoprotein
MKIDQIALVEQSFDQVKPIAPRAAAMFYERLFELDPSLRPLFRGDLARQGQMLMAMIAGAVNGLRNIPQLTPVLRQLGARHVAYGVEDAHYATWARRCSGPSSKVSATRSRWRYAKPGR